MLAVLAGTRPANAASTTIQQLMGDFLGQLQPNPAAPTPAALGNLGSVPPGQAQSITVYLKPSDPAGLAALVAAVQTPGDPNFHKFLAQPDFVARFAPSSAAIVAVQSALQAAGFTIVGLYANHLALRASGTVAAANALFGMTLHSFSNVLGNGIASATPPVVPAAIAPFVQGIGGFDTLTPSTAAALPSAPCSQSGANPTQLSGVTLNPATAAASGVTDAPGSLTPGDYQKLYDVMPLVQAGATGLGQTIGIITEENFTPADANAFWTSLGIAVPANHVQIRYADGAENNAVDCPIESDLDTEQAGAIAPNATVLAYVSAGGPAGLLDGYEQAASDNQADVVSSSFGTPELFFQPNQTELFNGNLLPAFNDVFSEMAVQGQTVFVAASDAGSFAVNRNGGGYYGVFSQVGALPSYTPIYSVNAVAANPLVTAAGGTTLPVSGTVNAATPGFTLTIPSEQAWSGSSFPLQAYAQNGNQAQMTNLFETVFPAGGGGGVSAYWPAPAYQQNLNGLPLTQPDQALIQLGGSSKALASEPAGFAGRNIPDLSANADIHTGYLVVVDGATSTNEGGTSIVAPQFAGTMALINQLLGHRVGQLNPLLYRLQAAGAAPARDITAGDNWGYVALPGFDQATGLGAMDAQKLFLGLKGYDPVE